LNSASRQSPENKNRRNALCFQHQQTVPGPRSMSSKPIFFRSNAENHSRGTPLDGFGFVLTPPPSNQDERDTQALWGQMIDAKGAHRRFAAARSIEEVEDGTLLWFPGLWWMKKPITQHILCECLYSRP